MRELDKIRRRQTDINAANKLIEFLYQDAQIWDRLPAYRRHGRLIYFGLFQGFMSSLKIGERQGELTRQQLKEYRLLQRRKRDVLGLIELLKKRDVELNKINKER